MWEQLVDCICRPPRDTYEESDLIGGVSKQFRIGRCKGKREDNVLVNKKGQNICCSFYKPVDVTSKDGRLPCVVYCHCNSGSMRDAEEAVYLLLPMGVAVFAFDFTGSGRSDGEWVTLGANEADDLAVVIAHLRETGNISTIGLWGRSMGAVTALMYSQSDPSIAGMVLDSPFSRLTDLMLEIVEEQKLPIPKAVTKIAVSAMRRSVRKRAQFDINNVSPLDKVPEAFIPALFGHGEQDTFIKIHHSVKLHDAYAGDKNIVRFEGDHNSRRPEFFYSSVSIFLHNVLQLSVLLKDAHQDPAVLQASSTQSYRLHGQTVTARQLNQLAGPWMCSQADVTSALQALAQEQEPVWDEGDVILQQVLELSLREAQAGSAETSSPATTRSSNSTTSHSPVAGAVASNAPASSAVPAGTAQRHTPSAAPAYSTAAPFDDTDEDEMIRAAIEASLKDCQPSSKAAEAAGTSSEPNTGILASDQKSSPAAMTAAGFDQPAEKVAELKTAAEQNKPAGQLPSQQYPSTASAAGSGADKLTGGTAVRSAAGDATSRIPASR